MQLKLTKSVTLENPVEGDLHLDQGQLVLIGEGPSFVECVEQDIRTAVLLFRGEWFLDLSEGVPYFEKILVKSPDFGVIKSIYRQVILSRNHVATVDRIDVSLSASRQLSVTFLARLTTGDTVSVGTFNPIVIEVP